MIKAHYRKAAAALALTVTVLFGGFGLAETADDAGRSLKRQAVVQEAPAQTDGNSLRSTLGNSL